jgi:hypothetical protein
MEKEGYQSLKKEPSSIMCWVNEKPAALMSEGEYHVERYRVGAKRN